MTKTQIAAAIAVAAGVAFVAYTQNLYMKQLAERFPELDRKVIRKAYATFMKNASAGKYGDMDNFSIEKMDALFLEIVKEQTSK